MQKLESLLQYMDAYLALPGHPDYPNALNGLQVDGPGDVTRIAAAVDASEDAVEAAAAWDADLLLVHHGLYWSGLRPLVGAWYRKVEALVRASLGVYSAHLPLDAHPEVGNCALLARALGIPLQGRFGTYEGADIGWWGVLDEDLEAFVARASDAVSGPVQVLAGGGNEVGRVAVVTGGGGSLVEDAAREGLDTLLTGEAAHHVYVQAREFGINVLLAGHYATETWGVKALAEHVAERFGLEWRFFDLPSGL